MLLDSKIFPLFEELLKSYSEHSSIDIKKHIMNYSGTVRYDDKNISPLVLQYINLKPKDLENLSRNNIADCSKKIADEIKRQGDK